MRVCDLAGGAADLDGRRHLRVERLDLARPAVQEQEDDGAILEQRPPRLRRRLGLQQMRQREPPSARLPIFRNERRLKRSSRSKMVSTEFPPFDISCLEFSNSRGEIGQFLETPKRDRLRAVPAFCMSISSERVVTGPYARSRSRFGVSKNWPISPREFEHKTLVPLYHIVIGYASRNLAYQQAPGMSERFPGVVARIPPGIAALIPGLGS